MNDVTKVLDKRRTKRLDLPHGLSHRVCQEVSLSFAQKGDRDIDI